MTFPARRPQIGSVLKPITNPTKGYNSWSDQPSIPLIRELLRRHADLPSYGMSRFQGPRAQKLSLWREYRNYVLQALSYFDAAANIAGRSACLPLYYAMLNFAKAELLVSDPSKIVGQQIGHGLSFSPIKAKKVATDALLVKNGVFRLFYERRTGHKLALNQRLPIGRLLKNIPEIGTQLRDVQFDSTVLVSLFYSIALDADSSWPVLLTLQEINPSDRTGKIFHKVFERVQLDARSVSWRNEFGISRRVPAYTPAMYQSANVAANTGNGIVNVQGADAITWRIRDILSLSFGGAADGFLTPSLYESKLLPMPASLARYAVVYYASSLVRYRPSIFDSLATPENAYLFDAIARECAVPALLDALSGLEGQLQFFYGDDFVRA
jgi:YaaC-like Protein